MKRLALACVVLAVLALAGCQKEAPQKGSAPAKPQAPPSTPGTAPGSPAGESTGLVPAKPAEDKPASRGPAPEARGPRAGRGGVVVSPAPRGAGAPAGEGAPHTEEIQAVVEKKLPDDSQPDDVKKSPAKP
jgi:hypothetical protein